MIIPFKNQNQRERNETVVFYFNPKQFISDKKLSLLEFFYFLLTKKVDVDVNHLILSKIKKLKSVYYLVVVFKMISLDFL